MREKRSKKRYVFATVGTLMISNFLIEKRARTDYFGAFGPSASLTLGSPCGRSTWPRPSCRTGFLSVGGSNYHPLQKPRKSRQSITKQT